MLQKSVQTIPLLMLVVVSLANAQPAELPKTGQTISYYSGDDGDLQTGISWPSPRYTVNGDTTVTDNLTGLVWAPDGGTPGIVDCYSGKKIWQGALQYVACLNGENYLGHNDWRLPNASELKSLVHFGQIYPYNWLNGQGFVNVKPDSYWSSTTSAFGPPAYAWQVHMQTGELYYSKKDVLFAYSWPVRGPVSSTISVPRTGQTTSYAPGDDGDLQAGIAWPSPRFRTNVDTSVTDNLTGLVWAPDGNVMVIRDPGWDPDGTSLDGRVSWIHALDYIAKLNAENYLGHNDWRLPNANEQSSLGDFSHMEPPLPSDNPFTNVQANCYVESDYWTSNTHASTPEYYGWFFDMCEGQLGRTGKSQTLFVWPVRSSSVAAIPWILLLLGH